MSMEISVLSDKPLRLTAEWQAAIDAEGFPLRLDPNMRLQEAKGFFPAYFGDAITGFECYHDDVGELLKVYNDIDFGHRWTYALGLRILGIEAELRAAWMAGTAYARATGGVLFDPESGDVMQPDRAAEAVRQIERDLPKLRELLAQIRRDSSGKAPS